MAQNSNLINCQNYVHVLNFIDCIFRMNAPTAVATKAINWYAQFGSGTGAASTLTMTGTVFEGIGIGNEVVVNSSINPTTDFPGYVSITGSARPAASAINLTNPVSYDTGRPGWHDSVADLNGGRNWPYFGAVQIDPGSDCLTVSASAAPGTVITSTMTAYGAPNWSLSPNAQPDPRINPFIPGTSWGPRQQLSDYTGTPFGWATGRYTITRNSDLTTATLAVGPGGCGRDRQGGA